MQQHPPFQDEGDGPSIERRHTCTAILYRRYAPALFEYLRRHTMTLHDAEDLLTEVFISVLRQDLSTMSLDEQRAWLWTVARNKISDSYRQAHRRQQVSLEALEETLSESTTPEQLAVKKEEIAFLRMYLQRLSATQQEVLALRFMGGLRCTEIAVLLNKREGTIRSLLSRALNGLRKYYER